MNLRAAFSAFALAGGAMLAAVPQPSIAADVSDLDCISSSLDEKKRLRLFDSYVTRESMMPDVDGGPFGTILAPLSRNCAKKFGWAEQERKNASRAALFEMVDTVLNAMLASEKIDTNAIAAVYQAEPSLAEMLQLFPDESYRKQLAQKLTEAGIPDQSGRVTDPVGMAMQAIWARMQWEAAMRAFEAGTEEFGVLPTPDNATDLEGIEN